MLVLERVVDDATAGGARTDRTKFKRSTFLSKFVRCFGALTQAFAAGDAELVLQIDEGQEIVAKYVLKAYESRPSITSWTQSR